MAKQGVLLTAFGGPGCLDDVGPFIERLTGSAPTDEKVAAARAKYERIGGCSPLPALASEIAEALEAFLAVGGEGPPVRLGMRYAEPTIAEGVAGLAEEGAERIVWVSLSPFESRITTGAYRAAVEAAARGVGGLTAVEAPAFYGHDTFVDAHADAVREAVEGLSGVEQAFVAFTAHSLPCEDVHQDPRYVTQLRYAARAVARRAGFGAPAPWDITFFGGVKTFGNRRGGIPWLLAYQSRGRREVEWLGPDLEDVLAAAARSGFDAVAVGPVGFVTDHMETLYDLDVVIADRARELGLGFARARVPNADPRMIDALASSVAAVLPGAGGNSTV